MSPRTGRPKSDNPKGIRFSIRLDESTFQALKQKCENEKKTVAEIIREAILDYLNKKK